MNNYDQSCSDAENHFPSWISLAYSFDYRGYRFYLQSPEKSRVPATDINLLLSCSRHSEQCGTAKHRNRKLWEAFQTLGLQQYYSELTGGNVNFTFRDSKQQLPETANSILYTSFWCVIDKLNRGYDQTNAFSLIDSVIVSGQMLRG